MNMRAPWERPKSSEYHKASDFEKQQWVAGIPSRFWGTAASSIRPKTFKYEGKGEMTNVPAATQQTYLTARIEQPDLMASNRLVIMTSSPTDEHALAAAALLATAAIKKAMYETKIPRVRFDDIQDYERCLSLKLDFYTVDPEILILHNLNDNSSRERLSLARDLMNSNEGVYRVIVAAADNPFQFAREVLYVEPQEVYHFAGRPKKKIMI
jgi:hypothetical protein